MQVLRNGRYIAAPSFIHFFVGLLELINAVTSGAKEAASRAATHEFIGRRKCDVTETDHRNRCNI